MIRKNKKSIKRFSRNPKVIVTAVLIVGIVIGTIIIANRYSPTSSESTPGESTADTTTPTTKSNSASNSAGSSSLAQGGIIDKNGVGSTSSPSSQWKSSSSGLITLQSPIAGSTLRPGDMVSGTAKTGDVQYRLVDNVVGVLAQGSLSVVNGKFAGVLQFNPHGTTGRLVMFSFDSKTGAEINRIEISLKLGS